MAHDDPLATVTHARLRAEQGDVRGARAILHRVLARRPDDAEAGALLARLAGTPDVARVAESEAAEAPPVSATGSDLAARFRGALAGRSRPDPAARLRRLLDKVEASRASDGGPSR